MAPKGDEGGFRASLAAAFADAGLPPPDILAVKPLSGGSIHRACHLHTRRGDFFCKWNPEAPPDMFPRERDGLAALAAATSLAVPKALGLCPGGDGRAPLLLLEYLPPAEPAARDWEKLGRGLAELHGASADRFGFAADNYCGLTPQENGWDAEWGNFYARKRIGALLRRLEADGPLPASLSRPFHDFVAKLPGLLGHGPKPALIHGDLWSGNFLMTRSGPALIDPAACYADRELEWGMMTLFGGFPPEVLEAYQEVRPLPDGWRERLPIYQAYHVLNHFLLFGGGYGEQAARLVRKLI